MRDSKDNMGGFIIAISGTRIIICSLRKKHGKVDPTRKRSAIGMEVTASRYGHAAFMI